MNDPDITLSTGRVVRHTPMPNGATDASIVGEHPEMTPAEWEEYTHVMPLHREIDRLKQRIASNLQTLNNCIEHMEWTTPQGRKAFRQAHAVLKRAQR